MDRAVTASIAVLIAMRIATTTTTAVSGSVTTTNAVIGVATFAGLLLLQSYCLMSLYIFLAT